MNFETDVTGALQRLFGDALRTPIDVFEHAAMRGLEPKQIIAAVAGRTKHGAVARPRQGRGGLEQQRGRQSRTVGIEHYSRSVLS